MPAVQYSSFDRGFDLGHVDVPPSVSPVIERKLASKDPSGAPWKKFLALALVSVMIMSAVAVIGPALLGGTAPVQGPPQADEKNPADIQSGTRTVNYTISNMFETYMKRTGTVGDYTTLGHHNTTMGLNQWWTQRIPYYPDTVLRNKYPFVLLYDYYSANLDSKITDARMGYGVYSFYRVAIDAKNLDTMSTAASKDLNFVPMLNPAGLSLNGGFLNFTWYLTYLSSDECVAINGGTHYANTYYQVPGGAVVWGGINYNDGWWNELQGRMDFNRSAAKKFLNLPGTGNLATEFTTANAGNALGTFFVNHWKADGTKVGKFDLYCTYDFSIDSGMMKCFLSLDPGSTADKLIVRIWGVAWGYEILMERFLEAAGIAQNFQNYPEDFYLNGTGTPTGGDLIVRQVAVYHMLAWKDMKFYNAAWNLDTIHTDACLNDALKHPATSWSSRYTLYGVNGVGTDHPAKIEWSPGTTMYGQRVMYWQGFLGFNLIVGEKLTVKLGNSAAIGYNPYSGTSDVFEDNVAKMAEITSHAVWGELVLGNGYPNSGTYNLSNYYDHATKTVTMVGPLLVNSDPNENLLLGNRNETGCPDFIFGVSKVSNYLVEVVGASPPYTAGVPYTLRITAKNLSDSTVTSWNGTVQLVSNNPSTTFGASSHLFTGSGGGNDNGVWTTTVTFGSGKSNSYVNATDGWYPIDVNGFGGAWQVDPVIPEFSLMLMPVFAGVMIAVISISRRRRKDAE